ncbi:MAG: tetratricopeptide repeat protein [Candidatus Eisenbacteria bacterium]|uniref:Tetratricopeptide repeat protein n=1 Tax=Eiseniibacteriota bacterium TaxID=2212470 RepID=A0A933W870_UNCEI|nr:tetratricopeptide repeat protein [Candidatus Eisenbacteria bacterium]
MDFSFQSVDSVGAALATRSTQYSALARSALGRGAERVQAQDYETALVEFKRAAAYDPTLTDTYRNMGRVYERLGRDEEAIAAYRRGISADSTSDVARQDLASFYMTHNRYAEAEEELKVIVRNNPNAPGPIASLGHIYLSQGRIAEAEQKFERVLQLAPRDAASHYSRGLVYAKQGELDDAITEFERALELRPAYAAVRAELAYAHFDNGEKDKAEEQIRALLDMNTQESISLAYTASRYVDTPKILFEDYTHSTFNTLLGPGTELSTLDSALATPGASVTFTVSFQFNQDMDPNSVQDIWNWTITKAAGGEAGVYNHGADLHPDQEAYILPYPIAVSYDTEKQTATLYFRVSQNANGNAVMDPSHWVFSFGGTDVSGRSMDPGADQYSQGAHGAF